MIEAACICGACAVFCYTRDVMKPMEPNQATQHSTISIEFIPLLQVVVIIGVGVTGLA